AGADDLVWAERQPGGAGQAVVRGGVEEQPVELVELLVPVACRPAHDGASVRAAEVAVVVGADLVSLAVGGRDLLEGARDHLARRSTAFRAREPDVGSAARMPRRPVEKPPLLGEQVDAADEESEVSVRPAGDPAPVGPEFGAAGAVEGDDEKLRRPRGDEPSPVNVERPLSRPPTARETRSAPTYNGHFCGPYRSAVMGWTARDWNPGA